MTEMICAADELVEIDLPGYLQDQEDPTCETRFYTLDGKEAR